MKKFLLFFGFFFLFSLEILAQNNPAKLPEKAAPEKKQAETPKTTPDKKVGWISITSEPTEAEVYMDGKAIGVTPAKIPHAPGAFKIYVFKQDHIIKVLRGEVKEGATLEFKIKLSSDVVVPEGINLKYAPEYIKTREQAYMLFQRALIYLSHFHVEAPKEVDLVTASIEVMLNALNKIRQREIVLKKELSEEDLKDFYILDLDIAGYSEIQWKKETKDSSISYHISVGEKKLALTMDSKKLEECILCWQKIFEFLQESYDTKKQINENAFFFAALSGMLSALKDHHTRLIPPKALEEMDMEVQGEFGGLGIVISEVNSMLTVITPMDDTPAAKAGIVEGDKIVEIEGKSTLNMSLTSAVRIMRGKPGTDITITIQRGAMKKKITLTRALIRIKYVKYGMVGEKIGIIRLSSFMGKKVPEQMQEAIEALEKQGMKALILDLRNNPGGLLDNAQKVASLFLKEGLVVYTKGRNPAYNEKLYVESQTSAKDKIPMVVLINKGSASASEIVSGALQDYKRAILIGETSYGKGSVQRVFPIADFKTAFAITIARYYLPKDRCIDKIGVAPDYAIVHSLLTRLKIRARSVYKKDEEQIDDLHMKKAIELLKEALSKAEKKEKVSLGK